MSNLIKITVMPSKTRYKLLVSFCLMSLLPILAGIYIASLFVQYPFELNSGNITTITLITLFSLTLSFLGFLTTKQIFSPLANIATTAQNISQGKLDEEALAEVKGSDELEDLTKSLKVISKNAREFLDKIEKLSLKDKLTGLHNATYIRERLHEEIQRAIHYQRPCSFAYLVIDAFDDYVAKVGLETSQEALKSAAKIFEKYLSEFDRAARISQEEFVVILPDKNKKRAIQIAEEISKDIAAFSFAGEGIGQSAHLTICVGISENPIDGVSADELYVKARDRMRTARRNGPNVIEAFA